MIRRRAAWPRCLAAVALFQGVLGVDILQTVGFSDCGDAAAADITVQRANIMYNNDNKTVTFDIAGTSTKVQNVTATVNVTAYGQRVYSNSFNPCDDNTFVEQLCPVPAGTFAAKGIQAIPEQYAKLVPAIAFQVPDIAAMATLQLTATDSGDKVACVQSEVTNGKTASVPAVSFVAAGVAGVALVAAGLSAAGAAVAGGSAAAAGSSVGGLGTVSPSFLEVFSWFQGMAMNGMLSVKYPQVYRSFAKNFGFSTGLVSWTQLQTSIDSFRAKTGGNLTQDNVQFLHNVTLVFPDGSAQVLGGTNSTKRAFAHLARLMSRQITTSVNATDDTSAPDPNSTTQSVRLAVSGIQAYVNELSIPSANTFMTVLLVVAIAIAAIAVGILLVKVVLELWALFGNFPKSLAGFRQHYWGSIARAITTLILLLYGIWVLYCVFQFTHGDSWAAKTLAGVTLAAFTVILIFFSLKIAHVARRLKRNDGDARGLYDDKDIWVKYSLFYESYRRQYWWIFIPTIVYMFVKGATLAGTDGHGMLQAISQLVIESVMLIFLLWSRPFERRAGNVINIIIQVVRVLSVVCILVFVEEFGIAQTTQTVTGVVLIAVQSALTGILAILIVWNALISCCKENPHVKRRKEMEKLRRHDTLTPLDARNSLLLDRAKSVQSDATVDSLPFAKTGFGPQQELVGTGPPGRQFSTDAFRTEPAAMYPPPLNIKQADRPFTPKSPMVTDNLLRGSAPMDRSDMMRSGASYGYGKPPRPPARFPLSGADYVPQGGGYGYGGGGGYTNYSSYRPPSSRGEF